jgi:MinD-like ATPase involved in chromosome partitioning or flagellar assembly
MTEHRCVIVHSSDRTFGDQLADELGDLLVLRSSVGDELGRLLTGDHLVAVLVVDLPDVAEGQRGWKQIEVVHEQLPALPIVAHLGEQVETWRDDGTPCPASSVVRAPLPIGELADVVRDAGSLPMRPRASNRAPEPSPASRGCAVIGLGGGVGTTTVSVLLAAALARRASTLVVDLDQRHGALAGTLRATPRYTTFDVASAFGSPAQLDEALPAVLTPIHPDLRLLAARDLPDVVVARAGTGDPTTVRELLRACLRTGDQVVADLGDLPLAVYPVLDAVGEVVVVANHDIRVVRRLPAALAQLRDRVPGVAVRTVLNRTISGLEPGPRELGTLVERAWDATIPESPAIHTAQNQIDAQGLLDLADSPPRAIDEAVRALLDLPATPGSALTRRRSRSGSHRRSGADLTTTTTTGGRS